MVTSYNAVMLTQGQGDLNVNSFTKRKESGMATYGYFLSSEEYTPAELLEQARLAEEAGFDGLWISDHFHPWNSTQGQSPFVWSMIGAISQVCDLPITTAVTCPTTRIHPAIIAQAAATSALLLGENRFRLGIGTGEALNEHILGDPWPPAAVRLEMLEEAVELIRLLWTGKDVSHYGQWYNVENARIYTMPEQPPEILMSGFGPQATDLAAKIADGYISMSPDREMLGRFRSGAKPEATAQAGFKVAWAPTQDEGVELAHRIWPNAGLPGELAQILPTPQHFEQASTLVTEEQTRRSVVAGNDVAVHVDAFAPYMEAGFDEVYVANMGPHYTDMLKMYGESVLPALRS
jgi:G6PDH family F420-dependent oxidoreductase